MLLDAWATPTLILPVGHWFLSPYMLSFKTVTTILDSEVHMQWVELFPPGWHSCSNSSRNTTKKKAGICCSRDSTAVSSQPCRRTPLHSLHSSDPAAETERLSLVSGIFIPHQELNRKSSCQPRGGSWPHRGIKFVNFWKCHLAIKCWRMGNSRHWGFRGNRGKSNISWHMGSRGTVSWVLLFVN